MNRDQRFVTITWRDRHSGEENRLTLGSRSVTLAAALAMGGLFACLVFGGIALRLHRETADLHLQRAELLLDRAGLQAVAAQAVAEIEAAREGLLRVRQEEAKIRTWLGLEPVDRGAGSTEGAELGGRGSSGDVSLDAVAPQHRLDEAEPVSRDGGIDVLSRQLADDLADLAQAVHERKRRWDSVPAISPVDGEHWTSSSFGWRRSPFTGKREFHSGLDLAGQKGAPVVAAAHGRVSRVVRDVDLGRAVTLDHGNGIQTIYGHLEEALVKKGQKLNRGEVLGRMGSSGRRSTGPHVHYAVKVDGKFVNPANYLLDRSRAAHVAAVP